MHYGKSDRERNNILNNENVCSKKNIQNTLNYIIKCIYVCLMSIILYIK